MNKEPIRTVKHGKPCLDYGTRTVPDDDYNDLGIGYGWRQHWTILCPECGTPSPYVMMHWHDELVPPDGDDAQVYIRETWTLHCPACHFEWQSEDEYYDEV